jgi:hypothetical protein
MQRSKSAAADDDPLVPARSRIVLDAGQAHQRGDRRRLAGADLEREERHRRASAHQPPYDVEPVGAAVERLARLEADSGGERSPAAT